MRRDDRDDPFDDLFDQLERMMNEMMRDADVNIQRGSQPDHDVGGRDVHLDVYEEDDQLRVVADVPGVEKENIDLKCDGEMLTIDAGSDRREYHERITLPNRVDEHSASASYNNGILEVTFDVADDSANIDLQ